MEKIVKSAADVEQNELDPIEKCVICGAETPYRRSTPISEREFYDVGSGQICQHCYVKIYIKGNWW